MKTHFFHLSGQTLRFMKRIDRPVFGRRKENDEGNMVLEKRRALTMEVETIKDALKEKKLQDMIKVYMGQRGIEE